MKKIIALSCGQEEPRHRESDQRGGHGGGGIRHRNGDYPRHVLEGPAVQGMRQPVHKNRNVLAEGRRRVDPAEDLRRRRGPDRRRPVLPCEGERVFHLHSRKDDPRLPPQLGDHEKDKGGRHHRGRRRRLRQLDEPQPAHGRYLCPAYAESRRQDAGQLLRPEGVEPLGENGHDAGDPQGENHRHPLRGGMDGLRPSG